VAGQDSLEKLDCLESTVVQERLVILESQDLPVLLGRLVYQVPMVNQVLKG